MNKSQLIKCRIKVLIVVACVVFNFFSQSIFATSNDYQHVVNFQKMGHGPALIMLPGTRGTSKTWPKAMLNTLANSYTLYLINYPGVGGSAILPTDGNGFMGTVSWLHQFISHQRISQVNLLGWSLGSMVAQHYALQYPVNHLILISSRPGNTIKGMGELRTHKLFRELYMTHSRFQRRRIGQELMHDLFAPYPIPASYLATYPRSIIIPKSVLSWEMALDAQFGQSIATTDYKNLQAKHVFIISGGKDMYCPTTESARLVTLIKAAKFYRFPLAGHGVMYQAPILIAKKIQNFMHHKT